MQIEVDKGVEGDSEREEGEPFPGEGAITAGESDMNNDDGLQVRPVHTMSQHARAGRSSCDLERNHHWSRCAQLTHSSDPPVHPTGHSQGDSEDEAQSSFVGRMGSSHSALVARPISPGASKWGMGSVPDLVMSPRMPSRSHMTHGTPSSPNRTSKQTSHSFVGAL